MSGTWDDQTPAGFTVQRVTADGSGGDFVRGRPATRQNALRYKVRSVGPSTDSDQIAVKSTLTAVTNGYGSIELSWGWPKTHSDWTEVSVVRSGFGHPSTVNDGVTVFRSTRSEYEYFDTSGEPLTIIIEDSPLQPGRWYYYTLFFRKASWEPIMYTEALTPRDHGHYTHLWESIPEYYRWVDGRFRMDQGHLQQFLRIFGFELDLTREYVESWQELYHADNSPWPLMYQLGLNLGVSFDEALGPIRLRSLIGQINELYEMRGTESGLRRFIETTSKYQTTISMGRNLLLLPDDSEFITGSGNWVLATTGVSQFLYHTNISANGYAYNATTTATSGFSVTNKQLTSGTATLTTSSAHGFSTSQWVTVTGVDSIFDGTYTITGTATNTFSYAKAGISDIPSTSVSPAGTAFVNLNRVGLRGADLSAGDGRAFNADVRSVADAKSISLTTLTTGVTTSDYAANAGKGVLVVTVGDTYGSDAVILACGFGTNFAGQSLTPRFNGVPVEENTRYGFSFYFKGINTYSFVTAGIYWFDKNQKIVGESSSGVSVTGSWQSVYVQNDSPSDSLYAVPYISITGRASGDDYKIMGCMFYLTGTGGSVTPLAPDYYLTLGTDELIGETAGYLMGG